MKYGETLEKDFLMGNNTHLSFDCIMSNFKDEVQEIKHEANSPKEECEVIVDCLGETIKDQDSEFPKIDEIEERYWKIVTGEEHCKCKSNNNLS